MSCCICSCFSFLSCCNRYASASVAPAPSGAAVNSVVTTAGVALTMRSSSSMSTLVISTPPPPSHTTSTAEAWAAALIFVHGDEKKGNA